MRVKWHGSREVAYYIEKSTFFINGWRPATTVPYYSLEEAKREVESYPNPLDFRIVAKSFYYTEKASGYLA